MKKNAFTLVELIVVTTILAVLATVAFISFVWYNSHAKDSKVISDISNIYTGLSIWKAKSWSIPVSATSKEVYQDNTLNIISYQWEVTAKIRGDIWISSDWIDSDGSNYKLIVNGSKRYYSVEWKLSESTDITRSVKNIWDEIIFYKWDNLLSAYTASWDYLSWNIDTIDYSANTIFIWWSEVTNIADVPEEILANEQYLTSNSNVSQVTYICPSNPNPDSDFVFSGGEITDYVWAVLTDVEIPCTIWWEKVTSIWNSAFYAKILTNVTIPNTITTINSRAFDWNALWNLIIPDSVTIIESWAFASAWLTSVVIPDSITIIREQAFMWNSLTSIVIPDSVTDIQTWAFMRNKLTDITLPTSFTHMWPAVFNNNLLPPDQAFTYARNSDGTEDTSILVWYGWAQRDNIIIPDSVRTINFWAFLYAFVNDVTIPGTVETLWAYSFLSSGLSLLDITIYCNLPIFEWPILAFTSNPTTCTP